MFLTSTPPIVTVPSVASYKRGIKLINDVFPDAVAPIIPSVCPFLIVKLISFKTFSLALTSYLKLTPLYSMS